MNWYTLAQLSDKKRLVKFASVNAYVSGFEYPQKKETVLDICFCMHVVMEKFQSVLSAEEYQYWQKNGIRSDFFSPDGNDYDKAYGTMNVYVKAFPSNKIPWLVSEINRELDKLDIYLSGIKYENFKDGDDKNPSGLNGIRVIRFEMSANQNALTYKDVPPDLNMNSSNASVIASLLEGRKISTDDGITLDAQSVIDNINSKLNTYVQKLDVLVKSNLVGVDYQDQFVNYLEHKIPILKQIAQWAVNHGYKEIYFA